MGRGWRNNFVLPGIVALAASVWLCVPASAQVLGTVQAPDVIFAGESGIFEFSLESGLAVQGLNGDIEFDPAVLGSPKVTLSLGTRGFELPTREISPGVFRFLLYPQFSNRDIDQERPVLIIRLRALPGLQAETTTQVTFSAAAAGHIVVGGQPFDTVSLKPTDFQSFSVNVLPSVTARPLAMNDFADGDTKG